MKLMLYGSPVATLEPGLRERLAADVRFMTADYSDPPEALAVRLDGCEAIIAVRYGPEIPPAPALRLVQVPGVGCDEIDLASLPPGATLCNVSGHGPAVAEYVVGALLAQRLRLCPADAGFRAGSWERSSRMGGMPHGELSGARVGLIGFGLIGQAVAARLKPFGVRIEVCNRSAPETCPDVDAHWPLDALAGMAAGCDILIVSVALTPDTEGLVDRGVLAALPAGAVLVNVARGPVVDEDALFDALDTGHLGGAILDVWWHYPDDANDRSARPSRHDFTRFEDVFVTPHISGWSVGTLSRRLDAMAENLERLSRGAPLLNVVRMPR